MSNPGTSRSWLAGIGPVIAAVALLVSCPNPLPLDLVSQVTDTIAPVITITSPADGSFYGTTVEITGTAVDATPHGDAGAVATVAYEILATDIAGFAEVNGSDFAVSFASDSFSGDLTVRLRATDWSGNSSDEFLTLVQGESDIPLFSVTAGNGEATINWEPVPLAESYTIYYTDNRSFPDLPEGTNGTAIEDAEAGMTLTGLKNGSMHVFRLRAHMPEGYVDSYSGFRQAVPLSPLTLTPWTGGELPDCVDLYWRDIPAGVNYEVYRSDTGRDGTYFNLTGSVESASYRDTMVEPGKVYYYRIGLESHATARSMPVSGQTFSLLYDPVRSSYPLPGAAGDIAVHPAAPYLYVCVASEPLQVLDVSDKTNPQPVTGLDLPEARGITVWGDYAFLSTSSEVAAYDISTADNPVLVTSIPASDVGSKCLIARMMEPSGPGNYLYGANGSKLHVIQVNLTTGTPVLTVVNSISLSAYDLAVADNHLYVAGDPDNVLGGSTNGLEVHDLADPADPAFLAQWDIDGGASFVQASGALVCVASAWHGLCIYDATAPANPVLCYTGPGSCSTLLVADSLLYAVQLFGQCDVLDIATPGQIQLLEQYQVSGALGSGHAAYGQGYLYVAGESLSVINDNGPVFSPVTVGSVALTHDASSVIVDGDRAYVFGEARLSVVSIADPAAPTVLGWCGLPAETADLLDFQIVHGSIAAVSDADDNLTTIDLSDPASPRVLGTIPGPYYGICAAGDRLLAATDAGIITFDISNPGSPLPVNSFEEAGGFSGLHLWGHSVVTGGSNAISRVDVSNPDLPVLEFSHAANLLCSWDISDSIVFGLVLQTCFDLAVFDTQSATPAVPLLIVEAGWAITDVDAVGDLAFCVEKAGMLGDASNRLHMIHAASGRGARLRGDWLMPYLKAIDVEGTYLYSGFSSNRLQVLRMDPAD